jgi:hypothetical protein
VRGVDIGAEDVAMARTRLTSARVIAPADRTPFADDSLEHIPEAWTALASYARAVRPGGWVVISVPSMRNVNVIVQFLILGDWPERPLGISDHTNVQPMRRRRLVRWCRGGGLELERWFDRCEENPWRGRAGRACDWLTLRLFHQLFTYQWQCRCRKQAGPPVSGPPGPDR